MFYFTPGPSQLDENISLGFQEAISSGFLSTYHRTSVFQQKYEHLCKLIQSKLNLPEDFEIYLTNSATECWQILIENYVSNNSTFCFNGAFGHKWSQFAINQDFKCNNIEFQPSQSILNSIPDFNLKTDFIALVQNETSNGSQIFDFELETIRKTFHDSIIAIDATSSMGGVSFNWNLADIWFASVQKCFGLPPGLALLFVNKKTVLKAFKSKKYNSIYNFSKNFQNYQTLNTPNLTNIFLLNFVLERRNNIENIYEVIKNRKNIILNAIDSNNLEIQNLNQLSDTVLFLKDLNGSIKRILENAYNEGLTLGNGYGEFKNEYLRIANFPQMPEKGFDKLIDFLLVKSNT